MRAVTILDQHYRSITCRALTQRSARGGYTNTPLPTLPGRRTDHGVRNVPSTTAEIGFDQLVVANKIGRRPGLHDLAGFEHVTVVRRFQRRARILFNEQH